MGNLQMKHAQMLILDSAKCFLALQRKCIARYIYNTFALSKHIGNMCMRLRNGGGRSFAEPFLAFRADYTYLPICFDSAHVLYLSCNFKS